MDNLNKKLSNWLFLIAFFVFIIVLIGGATRLTGSGLSMVEWRPFTGIFPPLCELEWERIFMLYKKSPQYNLINFMMNLEGFKKIFWLEYIHRFLGRLIGILVLVPVFFSICYSELRKYFLKASMLLLLVMLQGFLGWYMVKSGLVNDPSVSHYRLCVHLFVAFVIYGFLIWLALDMRDKNTLIIKNIFKSPSLFFSILFLGLTVCYGALVAGLKAGLIYNTFPLMGNKIIPEEFLFFKPLWENFLNNPVTVQFTHRVLAFFTVLFIFYYSFAQLKRKNNLKKIFLLKALIATIILQFSLGITTLLMMVPIWSSILHQAGALVLLTLLIFTIKEESLI